MCLYLNLVKVQVEPIIKIDDDTSFRDIVSKASVIMSTLKNEVDLFQQLFVQLIEIENPLQWWEKDIV
jgi:hypothetical protein